MIEPDSRRTVAAFVEDLKDKRGFRPGLRIKGVKGAAGVYEMTWTPDGRAMFEYGEELRPASRTPSSVASAPTTSSGVRRPNR